MESIIYIDAGVEHIKYKNQSLGDKPKIVSIDGDLKNILEKEGILQALEDLKSHGGEKGGLFISGKLSEITRNITEEGDEIMPAASLWFQAKQLLSEEDSAMQSLGILDISASGFMVVCINREGELIDDLLVVNPKCGAGSGINVNRILQKLDIKKDQVDTILKAYLGERGAVMRENIPIRADRCGVFSSSATISDKNQGIPLHHALAVTLKSEVLKATKRMASQTDVVYLTGGLFRWQFTRDVARDYFLSEGSKKVEYDEYHSILLDGMKNLIETIGVENFRKKPLKTISQKGQLTTYPSFQCLKKKYEEEDIYCRMSDKAIVNLPFEGLAQSPVSIGMDIGSTMAKIALSKAGTGELFFTGSYENHGDTIGTIKYIFQDIKNKGISALQVTQIGITGSGRYQVQKALGEIYPFLQNKITTHVENYAHAWGSLAEAKDYIRVLREKGIPINEDFCLLVDIGGEDTKISTIALNREELFDNAMNIKCSAGTGSLMDTLKSMFAIEKISRACDLAMSAPKAYSIDATCAVFLMENASKMRAQSFRTDEILASCNHAIVENMARTLWTQIEFPKTPLVLLHGQTMLSDPLPLAVTHRIQEYTGEKAYCLVPPLPGHRACLGLIKSMESDSSATGEHCEIKLDSFINQEYEKKIFFCKGGVCGDKQARCARTLLTSQKRQGEKLSLTLGGCTAINEFSGKNKKKNDTPQSYKNIWKMIQNSMPQSTEKNKVIIPRSFSISENAYYFSKILEYFEIPVSVSAVKEKDVLEGQPFFALDVCAPLIGATGQFIRLAGEDHGMILVPQLEFLPTEDMSMGRTCTTNQGGVVIAKEIAEKLHPQANFYLFDLRLHDFKSDRLAGELYEKLKPVFAFFNREVSLEVLKKGLQFALDENEKLKEKVVEMTAGYIETAMEKGINLTLVTGREYVLHPGIYDSHIGKLLRDKGVIALPSYVFDTSLDAKYHYMYWRNPHDILTKINAISNSKLHTIIKSPRLSSLIEKIEKGKTKILMSIATVTTFRCGPDSVTIPTASEISKKMPSLLIQSDAMIKELAHLENRINTHINQLNKNLHQELSLDDGEDFSVALLDEFTIDAIDPEKDVIYLPTMAENRTLTNVLRCNGITAIDNYSDDTYDLEAKVRFARKTTGDFVCLPLAGTYADSLYAVKDFLRKKKENHPLVQGKTRVLVFNVKCTGPCRQGQYCEIHKIYLKKQFGKEMDQQGAPKIKYLVGNEEEYFDIGLDEWAKLQIYQGIILKGIFHSLYLRGGSYCRDEKEFYAFEKDFRALKDKVFALQEKNLKPSDFAINAVKKISKLSDFMGGITKYFLYGLYKNNGLRPLLREFSKQWILPHKEKEGETNRMKIHLDGEAYLRAAQVDEIFRILLDSLGLNTFELSYTPLWSYIEYILECEIMEGKDRIAFGDKEGRLEGKEERKRIRKEKKKIRELNGSRSSLRAVLAGPLYKAAGLDMPHTMKHVLDTAKEILPTLKPQGELGPFIGEALLQFRDQAKLFLNVAPEGCMVASMGDILTSEILSKANLKSARVQHLFSLNGEINDDLLRLSLLKTLGPEGYYSVPV